MGDDRLLALYRELRGLDVDSAEDSSAWQNLTEVLEILAVGKGIKPSHLNGHSEKLRAEFESVARKHGLRTLRTGPHLSPQHREPRVDRGFLEWQQARQRRAASATGEVLWIYRDQDLKTSIELLRDGRVDETEVLGYPACCVRARSEIGVRLTEALVEGYQRQYGAVTVEDLIRCFQRGLEVALSTPIRTTDEDSRRAFPFIQLTACAECLRRADSPAARINAAMRRLATEVEMGFAREIQEASRKEWTDRQPLVQDRSFSNDVRKPVRQDSAIRHPRRNDRCPCGSGTKHKRCCGRR